MSKDAEQEGKFKERNNFSNSVGALMTSPGLLIVVLCPM